MAIRRVQAEESFRQHGLRPDVIDAARVIADKQGIPLREAVRRVPGADPIAVAQALSQLSGLPVVAQIDEALVTPDLIRELPIGLARERGILPLYTVDGQVVVGLADLSAVLLLDDLRLMLGRPVRPVIVPADLLDQVTNKAYDRAMQSANSVLDDVEDELGGGGDDLNLDDADLLDDPDNAPIIRFVNALLTQAIKERASDIHIEPFEKDLLVRFRVDGVLYEAVRPPMAVKRAIVSRIKIMAGLNIAEKRLPQDGRIRRRFGGREIDLRVSTVPVRHGERVVMRILEKGTVFSLDRIGMPPDILGVFRKLINQKYPDLRINHVHHAGNSSGIVDGAAAVLATSKAYADKNGLKPRARIVAMTNMGDCPTLMLNAPVPAARKVLAKAGLTPDDIDLWEINEAFAVVAEKFIRDLALDRDKVNVNGGAIALGHPIGATGSILIGTILDELERRDLRRGLVTMCAAGGMAPAIIIERV